MADDQNLSDAQREEIDTAVALQHAEVEEETSQRKLERIEALIALVHRDRMVGGVVVVFLAAVIGVFGWFLYQNEQDSHDSAAELTERRFNGCMSDREAALQDNEQDAAHIRDIQADINLLTPILGSSNNTETVELVTVFLSAKHAVIADINANQAQVRICTPEGIEAYGEGRPEAFEPTTTVPG